MKIKNLKSLATITLVSAVTALICLFVYARFFAAPSEVYISQNPFKTHYASYDSNGAAASGPASFTQAANIVIPVTVHINTKVPGKVIQSDGPFGGNDPFSSLFGGRYYSPGKLASGSGVIISDDGYVVTNNHVIDGASQIIVTLYDSKSYNATVIGTDPNTDLAVLKIDAKSLPHVVFGNSNEVQIGQWVLACGYPLNLQTTVTAGIISAKSRNLGINDDGTNPIDSYLQTDAAVNPGNSGGPLVDTDGKLIGINSAIATPTGSFAGYAYAIPSNIVRKVVNDILKYGTVQRAFLGVYLPNSAGNNPMNISFKPNASAIPGFPVIGVISDGAAAEAGIAKGDIITGIDEDPVRSEADLLGFLASHRPGDKVNITYVRDGKEHQASVVLKNKDGNTDIVKSTIMDKMGANFQTLPEKFAKQFGVSGGVIVTSIGSGMIKSQTDMQPYFVIVKAGNYPVNNLEDLKEALEKQGNNIMLKGFYPNQSGMFYYALNDVKAGIVN